MTAILALDLGTHTGWACRVGAQTFSGAWNFQPRRFEGGGMRYLRFRNNLQELSELQDLTQVYFEEVRRHAGTDAAHVYGGMLATLASWCEERSLPYCGVSVGIWKRSLPGTKGNASKDQVMASVQGLGFTPGSFDEADALGILHHALGLLPNQARGP